MSWASSTSLANVYNKSEVDQLIADSSVGTLAASRALVSDAQGEVTTATATASEVEYLQGLSENVQDRFDLINQVLVQPPGSRAAVFNASGLLQSLANTSDADVAAIGGLSGLATDRVLARGPTSLDIVATDVQPAQLNRLATLDNSIVPITDASGDLTSSAVSSTALGHISTLTEEVQPILDDAALWADAEPAATDRVLAVEAGGFLQATSVATSELAPLTQFAAAMANRVVAKDLNGDLVHTNLQPGDANALVSLTASRALASSAFGKVAASSVTATELEHLSGVTSNIQTQFNALPEFAAGRTLIGNGYTDGTNQNDVTMGAANPPTQVWYADHTISFGKTFTAKPNVSVTIHSQTTPCSVLCCHVVNATVTDFTIRVYDIRSTGSFNLSIEWLAIYIPP